MAALQGMDKDSAAGPDRASVRWLLIVAIELRDSPDFSGLNILGLVVQKIAAGKFSAHVRHLLFVAKIIPLDKGEAGVRPISFGIVL